MEASTDILATRHRPGQPQDEDVSIAGSKHIIDDFVIEELEPFDVALMQTCSDPCPIC